MSSKEAQRPYPHDAAALRAAVSAHLERLAKAFKNHPNKAVAPKFGMAAAATALWLGPRVTATVFGNSVEIQFEIGYHELACVLEALSLRVCGRWVVTHLPPRFFQIKMASV
jgi:hypothetical protein